MRQSSLVKYQGRDDIPDDSGIMRPDEDCALCGLCKGRTNLVLPSGDLKSYVAFVGEAPGENEDLQGRPFIGRAGKMLDKLMQEVGLDRSKVMITNTVKCRPPDNRKPTEEEMAACRQYLDSELYDKRVIIGLGSSACKDLLKYEGKMGDIVNRNTSITIGDREILFIPTYHPMACIYSRESKAALKETLKRIKEEYL
ncbi:MAG: uracil-DNA glycosylase [Candidatus Methanoplasma sp.]|jgi:DNA polymerase|nr:uracil-DNA glycosylase [Candidatus Methanoplasma sp.]